MISLNKKSANTNTFLENCFKFEMNGFSSFLEYLMVFYRFLQILGGTANSCQDGFVGDNCELECGLTFDNQMNTTSKIIGGEVAVPGAWVKGKLFFY